MAGDPPVGRGPGSLAARSGMAPFVFYRLRQDQLQAVVSSDALTQLQQAYYLAAPRAALRTRELITVLQALAAHGVVPVLFKGAVLAHTVYPNYVCRPMSDLDLWLSDAEIEVAVHALAQIGYVQRLVDIALLARQQPVDWILVAERARAWRGCSHLVGPESCHVHRGIERGAARACASGPIPPAPPGAAPVRQPGHAASTPQHHHRPPPISVPLGHGGPPARCGPAVGPGGLAGRGVAGCALRNRRTSCAGTAHLRRDERTIVNLSTGR
ncbi:MAG: nucleotidyltransferase family protein [Anaerolineae bacterium]|nr:nucleotidyltransferase family protein [Anaerolineae bacterium]